MVGEPYCWCLGEGIVRNFFTEMLWSLTECSQDYLASFPGLPRLQLLIASKYAKTEGEAILEAIKSWRCGRPGNEAKDYYILPLHFWVE